MHLMLQEERCPVATELLGRLYAMGPAELPDHILAIPSADRARLAVYCTRRSHLVALGRAIAAHCSESELEREAGRFGLRLFEEARERHDAPAAPTRTRRAVSLSTGILRQVVRDDDDDDEPVVDPTPAPAVSVA